MDVESDQTIAELKSKLENEKGIEEFPAESMKLIYNGKILENATKFGEIGYDAKKFVVVMAFKKKIEVPVPQAVEQIVEPVQPSEMAVAPVLAPPMQTNEALTPEQQSKVDAVVGMGYAQEQVIPALRAAFWNPERAVEYLLNGIPDGTPVQEAQADEDELPDILSGSEGGEIDPLEQLASMPQMNELRAMIRQNPQLLATMIRQFTTFNPEIGAIIQQNPEAFLQMLNQEPGAQTGTGAQIGSSAEMPRGATVVTLTQEEMEAVQRLKNMGFPEQLCIEAYLACDKNEEQAVNYILGRMEEEAGNGE